LAPRSFAPVVILDDFAQLAVGLSSGEFPCPPFGEFDDLGLQMAQQHFIIGAMERLNDLGIP
jgi:hypothetical protein